jgi:DNA-binding transcriptional ArsR family regulator
MSGDPSPEEYPLDAVVLSDPSAIRALAHPARLAVVTALFDRNMELTATQAAELAGITPSAMSFHLRALEKTGIVVRAESTGDARERPWKRGGRNLVIDVHQKPNHATAVALGAVLTTTMDLDRRRMAEALSRRADPTRTNAIDEAVGYNRITLTVTLEEAKRLNRDIAEVLRPYGEDVRTDAPDDAGAVAMSILMMPLEDE